MCASVDANTSAGGQWERAACVYLERRGLVRLAANFRCRGGELDLVMRDADTIVFVEVRQRSHAGFGGAAASIDAHKLRRLRRAAQAWLARYPLPPPCRLDVIAIDGGAIRWLRAAAEL